MFGYLNPYIEVNTFLEKFYRKLILSWENLTPLSVVSCTSHVEIILGVSEFMVRFDIMSINDYHT